MLRGVFEAKNFNPEKLPLLSLLSFTPTFPHLHHEFFFFLLYVRRTMLRGVFFVSCLVKAQVRSALNSTVVSVDGKSVFRNKKCETFLPLSAAHALYLLEIDDEFFVVVGTK